MEATTTSANESSRDHKPKDDAALDRSEEHSDDDFSRKCIVTYSGGQLTDHFEDDPPHHRSSTKSEPCSPPATLHPMATCAADNLLSTSALPSMLNGAIRSDRQISSRLDHHDGMSSDDSSDNRSSPDADTTGFSENDSGYEPKERKKQCTKSMLSSNGSSKYLIPAQLQFSSDSSLVELSQAYNNDRQQASSPMRSSANSSSFPTTSMNGERSLHSTANLASLSLLCKSEGQLVLPPSFGDLHIHHHKLESGSKSSLQMVSQLQQAAAKSGFAFNAAGGNKTASFKQQQQQLNTQLLPGVQHQFTPEAARKREMRLLKNREAARECRRKKKEYVKCLENRVAVLESQNKALLDEVRRIRQSSYYHIDSSMLNSSGPPSGNPQVSPRTTPATSSNSEPVVH